MPKPISAAGGVVFKIIEGLVYVLLINRNGVWDIPKGKLEKGESIPMCAGREVAEETGSMLPIIISDLGTTYHEYDQKGKKYGKTTFWYAMIFPHPVDLTPQLDEGIEQLDWVELGEAINKVGFQNLEIVLQRFKDYMS